MVFGGTGCSSSGLTEGSSYSQIKEAHYSFGLYGWIALLIISISFQVIEMFYVTPSYPKLVSKFMPLALFALLSVSSIVGIFYPDIWILANILIALLLGSYALLTLKRFLNSSKSLRIIKSGLCAKRSMSNLIMLITPWQI